MASPTSASLDGASAVAGRYQIHSQIGSGGLGRVFCAWDTQLGRWVALKRLHHGHFEADSALLKCWEEAKLLASLHHPNIVTIFDFGMDAEGGFVVMELIEGRTLEDQVAEAPFSGEVFLSVARQALEGLIAAHHKGILHRDLKPSNIMFTTLASGAFQVKILDFGLAKFIEKPTTQTTGVDGVILGSVYTMAPEQLNYLPLDQRTDLYALGCSFYYALAGDYPFRGATITDVMIAHTRHLVTPLAEVRPDLSPELSAWVMALIALVPEDRFATAADALAALPMNTAAGSGAVIAAAAAPFTVPPPAPAPARSSRLALWSFVGTLGLAAAGAAAYVALGGGPAPAAPPPVVPSPVASPPALAAPARALSAPAVVAAPPVSPPPSPSSKAAGRGAAGIQAPTNLAWFRAHVGSPATIEGNTVTRIGQSKSGKTFYLNFVEGRDAIGLAFLVDDFPEGNEDALRRRLAAFAGRRIQATGTVKDFKSFVALEITSLDNLKILE